MKSRKSLSLSIRFHESLRIFYSWHLPTQTQQRKLKRKVCNMFKDNK